MPFKPDIANRFHGQSRLTSWYNNLTACLTRPFTALRAYLNEVAHLREQIQQYVDMNARLIQQLNESNESEARLKDVVASLQIGQQEYQLQLKDISSELKDQSVRRETAEMQHRRLKSGCKAKEEARAKAACEAKQLEYTVAVLQGEKQRLETMVQKAEDNDIVRRLDLEKKVIRLTISNDELEARARKTKDDAKEELRPGFEKRASKLQRQVEETNRKQRATEAELVEVKKDKDSCSKELNMLKEVHSEDLKRFDEDRKAGEKETAVLKTEIKRLTAHVHKTRDVETELMESKITIRRLERDKRLAYGEVDLAQKSAQKEIDSVHKWAPKWEKHVVNVCCSSRNAALNAGRTSSANKKAGNKKATSPASSDNKVTTTTVPHANKSAGSKKATSLASGDRKATTATTPSQFSLSSRPHFPTEENDEVDDMFTKLPDVLIDIPFSCRKSCCRTDYRKQLDACAVENLCKMLSNLTTDCGLKKKGMSGASSRQGQGSDSPSQSTEHATADSSPSKDSLPSATGNDGFSPTPTPESVPSSDFKGKEMDTMPSRTGHVASTPVPHPGPFQPSDNKGKGKDPLPSTIGNATSTSIPPHRPNQSSETNATDGPLSNDMDVDDRVPTTQSNHPYSSPPSQESQVGGNNSDTNHPSKRVAVDGLNTDTSKNQANDASQSNPPLQHSQNFDSNGSTAPSSNKMAVDDPDDDMPDRPDNDISRLSPPPVRSQPSWTILGKHGPLDDMEVDDPDDDMSDNPGDAAAPSNSGSISTSSAAPIPAIYPAPSNDDPGDAVGPSNSKSIPTSSEGPIPAIYPAPSNDNPIDSAGPSRSGALPTSSATPIPTMYPALSSQRPSPLGVNPSPFTPRTPVPTKPAAVPNVNPLYTVNSAQSYYQVRGCVGTVPYTPPPVPIPAPTSNVPGQGVPSPNTGLPTPGSSASAQGYVGLSPLTGRPRGTPVGAGTYSPFNLGPVHSNRPQPAEGEAEGSRLLRLLKQTSFPLLSPAGGATSPNNASSAVHPISSPAGAATSTNNASSTDVGERKIRPVKSLRK